MNPLLFIVPVVGLATGAVILKKQADKKAAVAAALPGATVPIPGGTGSVAIPASTAIPVPNVTIDQLPPAFQAALTAGGTAPQQADINEVAMLLATGFLDPSNSSLVMKDTTGNLFNPMLPLPPDNAGTYPPGTILPTDRITFDMAAADLAHLIPGPGGAGTRGSSVIVATSANNSNDVTGTTVDPRVPPNTIITVPLSSICSVLVAG